MGKPEARVEDYLRGRVKEEGGKHRKLSFLGRRGAPDQMIWFPGQRVVFVECKAPGESVNPRSPQGREIAGMRADGLLVYVVNTRDQVDDVLKIAKRA